MPLKSHSTASPTPVRAARDPDLIESYVFEINALQARYSYLLRRVKELEADPQARLG